ncbi:hydrogenase [Geomonas sp. Red276]
MQLSGESMITLLLFSLAAALQAVSGIPLLIDRGSRISQWISTVLLMAGALAGVAGALLVLISAASFEISLPWGLPFGTARVAADPLSALFLLPVFLVTGASALYGTGYRPVSEHPRNAGRLAFFTGTLAASLTTLFLVRNGALFLAAWEVMALSAYFALVTDDEKAAVREAGTLYLITTHIGTLALFAMFSLFNRATGDFLFPAAGSLPGHSLLAAAIFLTALLGFGLKAGAMPLHVWLPSAHANAPSHISAILSGIVLKTGIYGLIRTLSFFADPPAWWGVTILVVGAVSGVVGVAFAIGQHDLKRLLAYHSIENIGIILLGVGLALLGQSMGVPVLVVLGLAGALLHVVNHALFKSLLFLSAGAVIHATGTREIDLMGGVARRLPKSALYFLVGAVAICGLPPLNGFVSELLVYLASFSAIRSSDGLDGVLSALAAPVLALIGGLAVACFVKVFGVVFLGAPRSAPHAAAHEAPSSMLWSMGLLAGCCVAIGLFPFIAIRPLDGALASYLGSQPPHQPLGDLVPFGWISALAVGLLAVTMLIALLFRMRGSTLPRERSVTWGCGYLAPTPRMQYSSSSFAAMLVRMFRLLLRPEEHRREPDGPFPCTGHFESHVPETVLEQAYLPGLEYLYRKSAPVRHLQHGKLNLYIFYTFITLVVLMALTTR